jgi:hypothetical protein
LITKDWEDFNKNITLGKEISIYEDEEGNYAEIDTRLLRCGVQYNELTEEQLNVAKFENKIPKDMKLKTKEVYPLVPKSTITGKDEDKTTIVQSDKKELRYLVWFIVDGMKNMSAFVNKEDALKTSKEWNDKVLKVR